MRNLYGVLGISPIASADEIKSAFRALAKRHHPDRNQGNEEEFKRIAAAYEILSDPERRAAYDRLRAIWLTEQKAVACSDCGEANRLRPPQAGKRLVCGRCRAALPAADAAPSSAAAVVGTLAHALGERLRASGERLGKEVLTETAAAVEELTRDLTDEAARAASSAIEAGFERIRERLGLPTAPPAKRQQEGARLRRRELVRTKE